MEVFCQTLECLFLYFSNFLKGDCLDPTLNYLKDAHTVLVEKIFVIVGAPGGTFIKRHSLIVL